jgi:hypothetical protein
MSVFGLTNLQIGDYCLSTSRIVAKWVLLEDHSVFMTKIGLTVGLNIHFTIYRIPLLRSVLVFFFNSSCINFIVYYCDPGRVLIT